jgi:hypothetical protein
MPKWYETCIIKKPENRILMGNSKDGLLVREINPKLEVLPLHGHLKAISFNEKENTNTSLAGYYHYRPKIGDEDWIPLLPGYSVFFQMAKKIWKFSILYENYYLKFQWYM